MQVTVEDLSSVKKTLRIEIPEKDITRELDKAYNELKKNAKIKGFRPGKAPRSVLENMFKKDVHADVTSRLIQSSFVEAVKETDLNVIGTPEINPPKLEEKAPYQYEATIEIRPDIDDIDFKGLALKKTMYTVTDQEVEGQLEMLRKNVARLQKIAEDREVQEGDHVLIDYEGLRDGKPFAETQRTENVTLKIGSGKISKDFDAALVGMKPGDEKEIKIHFPQDHFNQKLAGLDIDFQVALKEIREEILPEVDDAFAKKFGEYQNLDELRTAIVGNLTEGYSKRTEQELNEQIFTNLLEKTQFEVPEAMVAYELEHLVADAERSFSYHNVNMEDMGLSREKLEEKYRDTAVKQVRRHLILNKIIDQEGLTLTDQDQEDGFREMAANVKQPVEQIKKFYNENQDSLEYFKHTLLEKRAIGLIIESGKIEEVTPQLETEPPVAEPPAQENSAT